VLWAGLEFFRFGVKISVRVRVYAIVVGLCIGFLLVNLSVRFLRICFRS
jgi:hypothetical protein